MMISPITAFIDALSFIRLLRLINIWLISFLLNDFRLKNRLSFMLGFLWFNVRDFQLLLQLRFILLMIHGQSWGDVLLLCFDLIFLRKVRQI